MEDELEEAPEAVAEEKPIETTETTEEAGGEIADEIRDELEEIETSWQQSALTLGTAVAGLQATITVQSQLLQTLVERVEQQAQELQALSIQHHSELLAALSQMASPSSVAEADPRAAEQPPEPSPAEVKAEQRAEERRKRRTL